MRARAFRLLVVCAAAVCCWYLLIQKDSAHPLEAQTASVLDPLPPHTIQPRGAPQRFWGSAAIIDRRAGEIDRLGYVDEMFIDPNFRYPRLVRRVYDTTPELTEVFVAEHFLFNVQQAARVQLADLPAELQPHIKGLDHLFGQTYRLRFSASDLGQRQRLEQSLASLDLVQGIYTDPLQYTDALPNDPLFPYLWNISNQGKNPFNTTRTFTAGKDGGVAEAWNTGHDCSGIPIAVIDTGIDYRHPDLAANVLMEEGRSFIAELPDFIDDNGHGTHVSGTIGAVGNNGMGVAGVCWRARIIPIKVMDAKGIGITSEIIQGIIYAAKSSARIANMSIGSGAAVPKVQLSANFPYLLAAKEFEKAGKLLVATSGNSATDLDAFDYFPATLETEAMVTVGATTPQGFRAPFSGFGQAVDIMAPGVDILSTWPTYIAAGPTSKFRNEKAPPAGYELLSGTSMAAPLVTGALALFWQQAPNLSGIELRRLFLMTSPRSETDLSINENRTLNAAMTIKSSKFEFTAVAANDTRGATPGSPLRFNLRYGDTSFFTVASVEVLYGTQILAKASGPVESINLILPSELDSYLIVRVRDSAGRSFDADPYFISLGQSIPGILNFSRLQSTQSERANCSLALLVDGDRSVQLHNFHADTPRLCRKFCDIALPLMPQQNFTFSCAPHL